jgi:nucleoside-diphosphate-sugar epimerase
MRYIMSGSKGLIGEKLKQKLDKRGDECVMEIDQRCGSNVLSLPSIQLTPSTQQTDIFYHLAAFCKINETVKNPELAHLNNANGVFNALEFCRKNRIPKFVYMSSSRTISPEENPYTASKKYGECLCEAYKQCYGLEYLVIRPSTVYGEHHDLTTRLITKWVINAMTGRPLVLYGDKYKTLDFTHVDDFVDGVMCLVDNWNKAKNQAYDICGDDQRKLVDVAELIGERTGNLYELEYKAPEIAQPQQVKIDISKLRKFGYNPKIKLEEGVERLVKFYRGEGKKWLK